MRIACLTLLFSLLVLTACAADEPVLEAHALPYRELHEKSPKAREALRCYRVVEDDDTDSGKALEVTLNRVLVRTDDFSVVTLPSRADLAPGLYRMTVRMKMQGMPHSLGNDVAIRVGDAWRSLYPYDFGEEDAYREFSLDVEVREPLFVRQSPEETLQAAKARFAALTPEQGELLLTLVRQGIGLGKAPEPKGLPGQLAPWFREGFQNPSLQPQLLFPRNKSGTEKPTRGPTTPQATLRRVTVDWLRFERVPEPDAITLRHVEAQYAWRRPGERQTFQVHMHNRSGKDQTATLALVVKNGLDNRIELGERPVAIAHGAYGTVSWDWDIPADIHPWGQEVEAELRVRDAVTGSARSWFTVHERYTAVMIPSRGRPHSGGSHRSGARTESVRWLHPYAPKPSVANYDEYWAPTPFDSAGLLPDDIELPYIAGNSGDYRSIAEQAKHVANNAAHGIATAFYLEAHGTSCRAVELFLRNPEQVVTRSSSSDNFYLERKRNGEELLAWVKAGNPVEKFDSKKLGPFTYEGQMYLYNGLFPETVDRVLDGAREYVRLVGWTGIRWDSAQPFRAFNHSVLGQNFGKTPEEINDVSFENFRRFKREMRAAHPHFEFRMNAGIGELMARQEDPFDFNKARSIIDGTFHQLFLADHGGIEEEAWGHTYLHRTDYKYVCRNYLRAARFETAAYKYAGGHHAHMHTYVNDFMAFTPDCIYLQTFSLLGGAHMDLSVYGPLPDSGLDLGVYAARFSEYFWDPALRPLEKIEDKLTVDVEADIWSSEAGFERDLPDGTKQFVLMLINPPVTETWLQNRYGVLPAPINAPLACSVVMPEGFSRVKGVRLLDSSPEPAVRPLAFTQEGGAVRFEVPGLVIFRVIVVEFAK